MHENPYSTTAIRSREATTPPTASSVVSSSSAPDAVSTTLRGQFMATQVYQDLMMDSTYEHSPATNFQQNFYGYQHTDQSSGRPGLDHLPSSSSSSCSEGSPGAGPSTTSGGRKSSRKRKSAVAQVHISRCGMSSYCIEAFEAKSS